MYYFFHGKNPFLSLKAANKKITKLKNEFKDYEFIALDGEVDDIMDIAGAINTTDMFSQGKIIFIKRLLSNSKHKEKNEILLSTLTTSKADNTEIIFWENSKVASNTKIYKAIAKIANVEETTDLNKRTFKTWAKGQIADTDLKISPSVMQVMVEHTNYDPERFASLLEKLELTDKKEITKADIEENSANTLETTIWELIDVINGAKEGQAIALVDKLLKQQEAPHFILAMIIRNTRLLIMAKALIDTDKNPKEIAKILKIPPFTVYPIMKSAKKYSHVKLKSLYNMLYNLDFEIKIGNIEPELGLTLIATRL